MAASLLPAGASPYAVVLTRATRPPPTPLTMASIVAALISCPCLAPAARVMLSFMSTPPRSLHPARRSSPAISGPIFTHDACTFVNPALPSVSLPTACVRTHSRSVGPRLANPERYTGALK